MNADREFVKEKNIKSALIREKDNHLGVLLDYDQHGRLVQLTDFLWYEPGGSYSRVTQFDTLGRTIHSFFYFVKDSVDAIRPSARNYLRSVRHTTYDDDSLAISLDTSWDETGRIIVIQTDTIVGEWIDLPTPPKHRSVFHQNRIMSYQRSSWSQTGIRYYQQELKPDTSVSSGAYNFRGECRNGRIIYSYSNSLAYGDSTFSSTGQTWYTLNGKRDTAFYSNIWCKHANNSSPNYEKSKPTNHYGFIKSGKYFNYYYVSSRDPFVTGKVFRRIMKEPWNEYWGMYIPQNAIDPVQESTYRTIKHISWQHSAKPEYIYWPSPNY